MPTWFYVLTGGMAAVCTVGLGVAITVRRRVRDKTLRLLGAIRREEALVQSVCMIRDGAVQCPGVAWIAGGNLFVTSVFDKTRTIPLSAISALKEGPGLGRHGWFGKRVFHLETPMTKNFAIGVEDPDPWRKAFEEKTAPGR